MVVQDFKSHSRQQFRDARLQKETTFEKSFILFTMLSNQQFVWIPRHALLATSETSSSANITQLSAMSLGVHFLANRCVVTENKRLRS